VFGNGIYYHWYHDDFAGFTFPYYGFEWVQPLPEPWLSLYFVVAPCLGLAVALGWRFRLTAPLFALCYAYLFLLEKAHYLNHGYLFVWLTALLACTPAWREWSLDVRRRPRRWSPVAPAWSVYVFPLIMGIVYFFGGVNKINADWLLHAMPMHLWLQARSEMPVVGPLFGLKVTAYFMSWGGMLLDLLAPFLLLHKRLRWVAVALLLFFHATNHLLFNIGIFPWLSLVLTSMFFEPDWPRRFVRWLAERFRIVARWRSRWMERVGGRSPVQLRSHPRAAALLAPLMLLHIALPLRQYWFTSDVNWSEEGHRYSWRMMLRSKQGRGYYKLVDATTGTEEVVHPRDSLNHKQIRKLPTHPDMILQYAHHLRDVRAAAGQEVAVYGHFRVHLNGRTSALLLDPEVDLARTEWSYLDTKEWIRPEVSASTDSDRPGRK
jgi:hypothetical protein